MTFSKPWALAIIALALVLRIATAFYLGDRVEPVSGAYDQVSYDALAQSVLAGRGFTFPTSWYPFTTANEPTAHWSFLYTLYLAFIYTLAGHHPLVARLIQAVLSGLNVWLIYHLGKRLFGEWTGLASAALMAGYAYFIFFNAALMTQTFYSLALLAALDLTLSLAKNSRLEIGNWKLEACHLPPTCPRKGIRGVKRSRRIGNWIFLGFALGIGALLRQTLLLFTPILFAWLWWTNPKSQISNLKSQISIGILIAVVIIAAFILPWTTYNYLTFHDFLLLNSNGGFWFYASNHPNQGAEFNGSYVPPMPEHLRGLAEPALDRALYREALGFIVADPMRFVLLTVSRIKSYFWLGLSDQSTLVSNLSRLFSFTLYLPLMLYGLYRSRHRWRTCLPLYLYVAFDTTLHLISWAAPRYRLPSDAVLMPFAGLALVTLAKHLGVSEFLRAKLGLPGKVGCW